MIWECKIEINEYTKDEELDRVIKILEGFRKAKKEKTETNELPTKLPIKLPSDEEPPTEQPKEPGKRGRPKMSTDKRDRIIGLLKDGKKHKDIIYIMKAEGWGTSSPTIQKIAKEEGIPPNKRGGSKKKEPENSPSGPREQTENTPGWIQANQIGKITCPRTGKEIFIDIYCHDSGDGVPCKQCLEYDDVTKRVKCKVAIKQ